MSCCDVVVEPANATVEVRTSGATVEAGSSSIVAVEITIPAVEIVVSTAVVEVGFDCVGLPGPPGPEGPQGPPGLGVDLSDFREDEQLVGAVNGSNQVFALPYGDAALVADPGTKIKVYYNGQRLHEGGANDFTTSESGGVGTGVDTVTLLHFAPKPGDILTADYIADP